MRVPARMSIVSRQVIANRAARRAASDPSTPIAELIKLGEWWPSEVRANPAWQLAAVADADSVVIDPHKHGLQPYGCGAVPSPALGRAATTVTEG